MNQLSDVYTLDPTTIKFDDKYVVFNPLHTLDQYLATKASIKDLGQLDPILMLDGVCVDGRHRVRVCKELDIPVRCIDLPAKTSEEEIVLLCNKSTTSGRDFTMSQKAIQALKMVNNFNFPIVKAAMHMKVDRKLVSYASTIKGFGRQDLLADYMGELWVVSSFTICSDNIVLFYNISCFNHFFPQVHSSH